MSATVDESPVDAVQGLPEPPKPSQSVGDILRGQHEKAKKRKFRALPIPGYDSLYGVFRVLGDYHEVDETTGDDVRAGLDEADTTVTIAISMLARSCVKCYAKIDGAKIDLPPLGRALYSQLFPEGRVDAESGLPYPSPETDEQALSLLFPLGTRSIVETQAQLDLWATGKIAAAADDETVGN
jgi:hypothetical protein